MKLNNLSFVERLARFEKMTGWMTDDLERSMFDARANFLVAAGLVTYTETLGSYIRPYKVSKKGETIKTNTGERFYEFYKRLGKEYVILDKRFWGKNKGRIYDDLRNGLVHEYTLKRKAFTVYGIDRRMSDMELQAIAPCGIIFDSKVDKWHFINPRFFVDFKNAKNAYIDELKLGTNKQLVDNFNLRASEVNMSNFI